MLRFALPLPQGDMQGLQQLQEAQEQQQQQGELEAELQLHQQIQAEQGHGEAGSATAFSDPSHTPVRGSTPGSQQQQQELQNNENEQPLDEQQQQKQQQRQVQRQFFPATGREHLAERLLVLLEARRQRPKVKQVCVAAASVYTAVR